jgi:GNAT superfamily N-acetyltransferase
MEIQQASSSDFVEVLFLLGQCIKDMNSKRLKHWNYESPSPAQIKLEIETGTVFLYKELGIAKGMIRLTDEIPEEHKEIEWKSTPGKVLYIKRFTVHPLWQDSDVSDKLVEFAENYARKNNYSSIRLDALNSYPSDEKFFESRNFALAGTFHSAFQKKPFACYEKSL